MLSWIRRFRQYDRIAVLVTVTIVITIIQHRVSFQSSDSVFSATIFRPTPTYRLRISPECNCVVPGDSRVLSVQFCDPTQQQEFQFNGADQLVFTSTGECVTIHGKELLLGECDEAQRPALKFGKLSPLQVTDQGDAMCVSPLESGARLHAHLGLVSCSSNHSKIELIREQVFQQKSKALLTVAQVPQEDCDFPACGINDGPGEVVLLPPSEVVNCTNLTTCLTVVVKTTRRPHLVLRLAQSIRDTRGYDLPMVAYDDGGEPYPEETMEEIRQFPLLRYIVDEEEDVGISRGRNLAIQHADTKYIMVSDDDMLFTENDTDIKTVVNMLDTTDLSLVGGRIYDSRSYSGELRFGNGPKLGIQALYFYRHTYKADTISIVNFPTCVQTDITSNFFIARRDHILGVGGWTEVLKIKEHRDIFLKLKAAKRKVAFCPHFQHLHKRSPSEAYKKMRSDSSRLTLFEQVFKNTWNVHLYRENRIGPLRREN